ncbi:MAG: cobalamin-binding protein [Gammaproteobacteria bacterium]|nr:MAG: cobalamin-binding protein [Gammaproteobacteria bacterium]
MIKLKLGAAQRAATIWCCLLVLLPLPALALEVTDDTGQRVHLDKPARRIISLAPHITELLFAAGAGDAVVGAVNYSNYPPEATRLASVGNYESLNLEVIAALQPDLVVAWKSGNSGSQIERLSGLGLPVFYSEPRRLEDIASNLKRLGRLAASENSANAAAARFNAHYRQLEARYSRAKPVRVFYEIWHRPLMTVSGKHLISQVIKLCGGHNIFSDLTALAPTVNPEAVLAANPEAIIASGMAAQQPEWLDRWRNWPQLAAVKHRQLYFIPPDLIQRQTPRVLEGAELMCEQLEQARMHSQGEDE